MRDKHCDVVDLIMLEAARSRRPPLPEIVLWIAASRSPSESQTSECSDLLSRSRATFVIVAQRQPGKLNRVLRVGVGLGRPVGRCGFSVTGFGCRVVGSVMLSMHVSEGR